MDSMDPVSEAEDRLPPIWNREELLSDWENAIDDYLRQRLRETFVEENIGGARPLFEILVEHERIQPQDHCYYNYFMWLALRTIILAEEMSELEGQAPALARLFCLLADEGERKQGQNDLDYSWRSVICNEAVDARASERQLLPPGFCDSNFMTVIIPDPNFLWPPSPAELARFGREFANVTRFWSIFAHADAIGGFKNKHRDYPGILASREWHPFHIQQAVDDPAHRPDLDLLVPALTPLAQCLRDEEAIAQSQWGQDGGLQSVQELKLKLQEVFALEILPDLTRARLAALYEDLTTTPTSEFDTGAMYWKAWLLRHLQDSPSSLELHASILAELRHTGSETSPAGHEPLYDAALGFVDAIFACAECEGHTPLLAHVYSLMIDTGLDEDATKIDACLYQNGILPKLGTPLIRPGYVLVDSRITPDPSWSQSLDFTTLVAYGRAYASQLRLWTFLGHLDARIDGPLPQNNFPGHFILTHWTPDRVRCSMMYPGHYTDLDMLVAAMYPLRDWLTDGAEMIDGTREIRDELITALKEVFAYEDVPEITRSRLAEILDDLEDTNDDASGG